MSSNWQISLKIQGENNIPTVMRCLRKVISTPVSEIAAALQQGRPVPICTLFTNSHAQDEKALLNLISEIDHLGVTIGIYISGQAESKQYLQNILQRHREISYDTQMETDLELGEDTEETQAWALGKASYPPGDA
nr:hypothetical protein [uncultured Pseudomonas sp.]